MKRGFSVDISVERKHEIGAYLLLFVTALIWAGTWPLGRWLVSEDVGGETIPPMIIASIRYFLVIPCFFFILKIKEESLNISFFKSHWKIFLFMGISSVTIYQAGYLIGEYFTSASDAVVIVSSHPVLVLIFASLALKRETELSRMRIFGTLLSFSGILLIFFFSPNEDVPDRILGDILIFLGAIFYAMYIVASRYFLNKCKLGPYQPSSLYIITWVSFLGFLTTLPVAFLLNPEYVDPVLYFQVPERVWFGVAYLAFLSTVVAYWFYLEGVKRLSASRAAIFQNLVPIFGVILSVILLGEIFDPLIHVSSILLIIFGITLVNRG